MSAGETSYRYDAENQRIGVNQTRYVINSQPALSQVLVKEESGVKTFYVYGLGLIGEEKDGEYRSYHFDFRGSTVAITDHTGKVVERFQYGPYGELLKGEASVTPFLFNWKIGVMSDDNGLYYMRVRYYSPAMKRFVNQDLLLGNITEGQTLNRYAFVTEQPVSLVEPFGLFGRDDAISLVLDFVPVVGSCKGISEFVLGYDPITWEPIPRWIAFLGIIPGEKYFTKADKFGEAIVYVYKIPRNPIPHTSIEVITDGKGVHTHQMVDATLDNTWLELFNEPRLQKYIKEKYSFVLSNPSTAQAFQEELMKKGNLGKYDYKQNSCISHCVDVLEKGGADIDDFKEIIDDIISKLPSPQ